MIEITVLIVSFITLIILKLCLNINFKTLKKFEVEQNEKLKEISKSFKNDEEMCKDILKKFNDNPSVKIKIKPEYNNCLYTVYNNTIIIGNFKEDYMKPQTIAHECIHSSQSKIILWSNFLITNIYIIYFITTSILAWLNVLSNKNIYMIILIFLSLIQYILRFTLEYEAMIKAKYIAKEYIKENKIVNKDQEDMLIKEYDRINKVGIPFMNYYQISMNIIKIMIFAFICLVQS